MLTRLLLVVLFCAASTAAQTEGAGWDWLNRGVQAFKAAHYQEAVDAFQHAVEMEPGSVAPHLYLATAYMSQWIPGAGSPENAELARKARAEFGRVLQIDPRDLTALQSLASLAYNEAGSNPDLTVKQHKLDEAMEWNRKVIEADPRNQEAYYSLGVIAWSKFYPELTAARAALGMRPEDPGPLTDFSKRQDLRARFGTVVDEGIRNLEKALEIDPAYDDAMAYLNLLIRERGDLRDSQEEWRQDSQTADTWVQRALETKKAKAGAAAPNGGGWFVPTPGAGGGGGQPVDPNAPQRIRVGAGVQQRNLLAKVDPAYPPLAREARVQGTVRFTAVIGKDGQIRDVQLISGHPLLVQAAVEAVKQWSYKPTLLNGQPVEVVTVIDVPFRLNQ